MTQRVIKYRAYDMHFEEMCYVSSMFWPAKKKNGFDIVEGHGVTSTPYRDITITEMNPLMQFTGRLDKHEKEIYHNDFIKSKCGDIMLVVWRDDLASFALRKKGWMYDHYFGEAVDAADTEIIGNIFTNPELIEK